VPEPLPLPKLLEIKSRSPRGTRSQLRITQKANAGYSGAFPNDSARIRSMALHDPARLSDGFLVKVNQGNQCREDGMIGRLFTLPRGPIRHGVPANLKISGHGRYPMLAIKEPAEPIEPQR
jgi:hypothetical protein